MPLSKINVVLINDDLYLYFLFFLLLLVSPLSRSWCLLSSDDKLENKRSRWKKKTCRERTTMRASSTFPFMWRASTMYIYLFSLSLFLSFFISFSHKHTNNARPNTYDRRRTTTRNRLIVIGHGRHPSCPSAPARPVCLHCTIVRPITFHRLPKIHESVARFRTLNGYY